LSLSNSFSLLLLHLVIIELFLLPFSLFYHEQTLFDFLAPELINILLLVLLDIFEVCGHFIEEQGTVVFITVGHILLVVSVLEELEFAIHEGTSGKVEGQRGLVRLV
jgi:hypothetical protein